MKLNREIIFEHFNPIVSIVGLVLILAAFFVGPIMDLLDSNHIDPVKFALSIIASVLVVNIIIHQFEQSKQMKETNDILDNLVRTGGILKIIESSEEYYRELKSSIENSKDSIRLMYLTDNAPREIGKAAIDYWDWFSDYMNRKNKNVIVRRIASLDNEVKNDWLYEDTKKLAKDCSYSVKCFVKGDNLPLINVDIIDKKEVFLFGPHALTPRWVYIKNPDIGEGMSNYYTKLWDSLNEKYLLKKGGEPVCPVTMLKTLRSICPPEIAKNMKCLTENSNE